MDKIIKELIPYLDENGVAYSIHGSRIRVPLPNNFGKLEIGDLEDNDDIIGLVGEEWHTHGELLKECFNCKTNAEAIIKFIQGIIEGKIFLIEESKDGKPIKRTINDDLESFRKYTPEGTTIKVYNET